MAFRVKYSEQSADDLDDIINYISNELYSPQAAERLFDMVEEKIEILRENPYLFPLYHDDKLSGKGLRFAVIGNYLMFYTIDDRNSIVNIVRIVYGKRNIPVIFEE